MDETCFICGGDVDERDRHVLVRGKAFEPHCSEFCLTENIRKGFRAGAIARRRWLLGTLVITALLAGAYTLWQRHRAPQPESIAFGPLDAVAAVPEEPTGPIYFGPAWPPTDADWTAAFAQANWIYPLPGPIRRDAKIDGHIFGPPPPAHLPAACRPEGHCGVDLGGELWGEHVYAALDGVVDRVHGGDERGGQYVRLSHFGGMVFTQYFHLAGTPRHIVRGARVKAGDVIALVGDTGLKNARRHLHFTVSVQPSPAFPEVYWDPIPFMSNWPLHIPPRGTVAGLASNESEKKAATRRRQR